MIDSREVYETVMALAKKDARGAAFNIPEYNEICKLVNAELYNFYVSRYEADSTVSDIMSPLKVRNTSVTLTAGLARLPGVFDRLAGNPTIAYPWGIITATATVAVVNNATAKLKITSPGHNLKDGDIITATGLSVHTVTSKAIKVIDRDNFWVDVNYAGADALTNAAWTLAGAGRKQVDMITELEYSVRVGDANLKPTISNPVAVLDGNVTGSISAFASGGAGLVAATSAAHGLTTGMTVTVTGSTVSGYNGTYPITVTGVNTFTFSGTWTATGTAAWACPELTQITVYPATLTSININYLKFPATPFLDYYVASTGIITYLAEGARQVNVPAGAVYSTGAAGGAGVFVDSLTSSWQWDRDNSLPHIIYAILQKVGINMESMSLAQLSTQLNTKEETQV
jgi:DNA/RNA endonuclease YhcR with UshA esterase domain